MWSLYVPARPIHSSASSVAVQRYLCVVTDAKPPLSFSWATRSSLPWFVLRRA
jgi:hypothetical protein